LGVFAGTYPLKEVCAMVTREDIMARRDDLMARREELMERAQDIRERFQENVNQETVTTAFGWTLVSGGIAFGVTQFARGRRGIWALLLPISLIAGGAALLGTGFAHRRGVRIGDVEADIRLQLAELDPIARMQVLKDVRGDFVPFVRHSHN
jgi:hypothetical protein